MICETLNNIRRLCTSKLKPSGKVVNFEVKSRNPILRVKDVDLGLIIWNDIISFLGKP